ncbi:hypothetical protein RJ639_005865 [Escallonia herrerae]|uniref:Uncharacterized protein n=1 Tax=Escallonia herrerae TaxID=1293975 RepID=A0AA89AV97_9ASTE|nr:hypothetical protein RJ639_005865 [Escallonia herrerae]
MPGRHGRGRMNTLVNKFNVDEEYMEAFRTKSYIEMCSKVQGHLSECLLEPPQETLSDLFQRSDLHHLLVDYFKASLEACNTCDSLLQSVYETRANYRIIERINDSVSGKDNSTIFRDLAQFALLKNPLSTVTSVQFRDMHDGHYFLLGKLTLKCKNIRRRTKFTRCCKKVVGVSLVVSYTALMIALLVLALHSMVGMLAMPGLVACTVGLYRKRNKVANGMTMNIKSLERLGAQLDVAAKGIYTLANDFDTMGRLARRLHDEIEHSKVIAGICVRNLGKGEVLKEVVRDFRMHETGFLEQLEELEEHIYLCFLTINRSRRLVLQEIVALHSNSD